MDSDWEDPTDSVDVALRRVTPDLTPSPAARRRAEEALTAAIAEAQQQRTSPAKRKRARSHRRWAAMTASAVAAGVAAVLVVPVVGQQSAATAALTEFSEAMEATDPVDLRAGSYAYTRSRTVALSVVPDVAFDDGSEGPIAYLLPTDREVWVGPEGLQMNVTIGAPTFFSEDDEARYYAAGLDEADEVGRTRTETFSAPTSILEERAWPTDPQRLRREILGLVPPSRGLPADVEVLDIALDLLRETAAPPALRAAVLRMLADLDGIELAERRRDGGATFAVTYRDQFMTRQAFTLDGDGNLVAETQMLLEPDQSLGIPADTAVWHANYEPPEIVDSLDTPAPG